MKEQKGDKRKLPKGKSYSEFDMEDWFAVSDKENEAYMTGVRDSCKVFWFLQQKHKKELFESDIAEKLGLSFMNVKAISIALQKSIKGWKYVK